MTESDSHLIWGGKNLADSMRYNGYANPAYALAEIVDNSVEAGATYIKILCRDELNYSERKTYRLAEIAVLDDGVGMSKGDLWNSLRFAEGTRSTTGKIGRFGMGLPNSSISQCRRVDVYSWQRPNEIFVTHLDLDEIENENVQSISEPKQSDIPAIWKDKLGNMPKSGTMVVWSKLDRCRWKKASTLIENSKKLIGRLYRKFIHENKLEILMISFGDSNNEINKKILPNDPLYLMIPSSTPGWENKQMFQHDGEKWEINKQISSIDDKIHIITMRFTYAKKEAREGINPGSKLHGKHASANLGVSVIREGRELYLDTNLLQTYDPMERWWGAEIEFSSALDDFFGVTYMKQEALNFSTVTKICGARARNDDSGMEIDESIKPMEKIVLEVLNRIRKMRTQLDLQNKGQKEKSQSRHEISLVSEVKKHRSDDGFQGSTDKAIEESSKEDRQKEIEESLIGIYDETERKEKAHQIVNDKLEVITTKSPLSGNQFFDVRLNGGVEMIVLNTSHSAYKNLISVLEDIPEDITLQDAKERLKKAHNGVKLLLGSWARYEDESDIKKRKVIQDILYGWGEVLDYYMSKE